MRLHRLEFSGVGPFRDPQEIDFDELASSGLFLIDGATGSGKTTIIDAIVFALFGVVSGPDSDPDRIRSSYCAEKDPTGVACEFSVNGRRHRITRVPAHCRDPWDPTKASKSKPSRQTLKEFAVDGTEMTVLTAKTEIDRHVEDLLGMRADQFRQLVVLPQGQFADLLRRTPVERLNSLAPLLGDAFFARVQEDLRAQGDEAARLRNEAGQAVHAAAQQLAGRLRIYLNEADPAPEIDFADADASDDDRSTAVQAILDDLSKRAGGAAVERDAQETITHARRDEARLASAVATSLRHLVDARVRFDIAGAALLGPDHGIQADQISSRIGELNRLEGALKSEAAWESEATDRATLRTTLVDHQATCMAEAHRLRSEKATIPEARVQLEQKLASLQRLSGGLEANKREEDRLEALVAKATELSTLATGLADRAAALEQARLGEISAISAADQAELAWTALVDQQRAQRSAELASNLSDGNACPVCGSIEHPQPAHTPHGLVLVSDADVDAARKATADARTLVTTSGHRVSGAHARWQESANHVVALEGALSGQSQQDVSTLYEHARSATAEARRALEELPRTTTQIADLTEREQALDAQITERDKDSATLAATVSASDKNDRERRNQIRELIGSASSATDLLSQTQDRNRALAALESAQAALATAMADVPVERRDLSLVEAEEEASRTAQELQAAADVLAKVTKESTALASAASESAVLAETFASAMTVRRQVEAHTATAVSLAALVTASNPKRLQLRSYALQRRFESVLAAASVHLERMSAGKFTFESSDDTARAGQSGLGIALRDTWTGHRQDPKSLSGGETFYASLSLALGLADVVRGEVGGSALETLFVDEGFGSLDQDTLYQVLDQLDELRSGRRAVGVVSHVAEVKESIPDRIEVRRGADSSSSIVRPLTA